MNSEIIMKPIGVIYSPFKDASDNVPIQGRMNSDAIGRVKVFDEYYEGLKDLEGFSHILLLYFFHSSPAAKLITRPYMEDVERGIFSIRSPHRPNHIGLTLVELIEVKDASLKVRGIDVFDGTPLLDIKPYNHYFDTAEDVKNGWYEKHFKNENMPDVKVNSRKQWLHE